MGAQPHPDGSFAYPAAHDVTPIGWQSFAPRTAYVPGAHGDAGAISTHPSPSFVKPSGQSLQPTLLHPPSEHASVPPSAAGGAASPEFPHPSHAHAMVNIEMGRRTVLFILHLIRVASDRR
jgi:hypothetical protein